MRSAIDVIEIDNVSKRYGRGRVLSGVGLSLGRGSMCALLGANGAGKSTLLGIVSTLVRPSQGTVRYRAADGGELRGAELRREIGVLAHEPFIYGQLSADENLAFWGRLHGLEASSTRASELLDRVGLEPGARARPASTYSRGMLQRLALARALLHDPSVLLLDEPFTGLDRAGIVALREALGQARADGRIVLVVTHDLGAVAEHVDRVVILRRGRVVHDAGREAGGAYRAAELQAIYDRYSE